MDMKKLCPDADTVLELLYNTYYEHVCTDVRVGRKSPHSGRKEMTILVKEKSPTARLVIS